MYDDYDLDYTYDNARSYDLDETYEMWVQSYALDDDACDDDDYYARDTQDYDALAYKHYAWYNLVHITHTRIMQAHMVAQKRLVRVTLDIMCYDDLELEDLDWKDLLELEGDESVDISIKDYSDFF